MATVTLDEAIRRHRAALSRFFDAIAPLSPAEWEQPLAPGKWSPGQIAEHLALTYEVASQVVRGTSSIPPMPRLLRPMLGWLVLWTIRIGRFPRGGRAMKGFLPSDRAGAREQILDRLTRAADAFDAECAGARREDRPGLVHPIFGKVRVVDYVLFNDLHTRHHTSQIPGARSF